MKTAQQSFCMTLWFMTCHHTKFGYKKGCHSEDILWTHLNWNFETFTVTLILTTVIQYFHWTLWLMVIYHQIKFGHSKGKSMQDSANFVGLVQYATICPKMSPKKLLCAFVLSRLNYCNSLLAGCPKYLLSKLQKVKNNGARLTFRTTRSAYTTPMLHSLHWLPIEQRIEYRLSLLCFKIISHQAPIYHSELLHLYTPSWQLRSSTDTLVFRIPSFEQSPVVSILSLTRFQLPGTNSLFLSAILPLSALLNLPWKPFSF